MRRAKEAVHVDERLARLLDVEQRLEARVRAAEEEARARVEGARARLARRDDESRAQLDTEARAEERTDLEDHASARARIEAEAEVQLARLAAVPDEAIEDLARRVVAALAADEEGAAT